MQFSIPEAFSADDARVSVCPKTSRRMSVMLTKAPSADALRPLSHKKDDRDK